MTRTNRAPSREAIAAALAMMGRPPFERSSDGGRNGGASSTIAERDAEATAERDAGIPAPDMASRPGDVVTIAGDAARATPRTTTGAGDVPRRFLPNERGTNEARFDPAEWIEIGHIAVRTRSVTQAAKIAAKVHTTRQRGVASGTEWICLALFRELVATAGAGGEGPRARARPAELGEAGSGRAPPSQGGDDRGAVPRSAPTSTGTSSGRTVSPPFQGPFTAGLPDDEEAEARAALELCTDFPDERRNER